MIRLTALRRYADLLDRAFRIPGTNIRFGVDPIVGLIPGLGDLASPAFAALLVLEGTRLGLPRIVLARMVVNALIDAVIGAIPFAGVIGDVFFRANIRNLALLERHSGVPGGRPASRGDYIFVWTMLAALLLVVVGIVWLGIWLLGYAWGMLRG